MTSPRGRPPSHHRYSERRSSSRSRAAAILDRAAPAPASQYSRGAIDGVGLVGSILIAEPQGQPRTVGLLVFTQKRLGPFQVARGRGLVRRVHFFAGLAGSNRMGGQVIAAAVKGKLSPAAAKGRPSAIAILQRFSHSAPS